MRGVLALANSRAHVQRIGRRPIAEQQIQKINTNRIGNDSSYDPGR